MCYFIRFFMLPLLLAAAFTALAEPTDLTGLWKFQGQVLGHHRIEVVHLVVRTQEGRDKLEELKSQNFQCVYSSAQAYRCKRISGLFDVMPEHLEEIRARFSGQYFEILKPTSASLLISEGSSLRQWEVPSIVYTKDSKAPNYLFWEIMSDADIFKKIQIQTSTQNIWLNVLPEGLGEMVEVREHQNLRIGVLETQFFYHALFQNL